MAFFDGSKNEHSFSNKFFRRQLFYTFLSDLPEEKKKNCRLASPHLLITTVVNDRSSSKKACKGQQVELIFEAKITAANNPKKKQTKRAILQNSELQSTSIVFAATFLSESFLNRKKMAPKGKRLQIRKNALANFPLIVSLWPASTCHDRLDVFISESDSTRHHCWEKWARTKSTGC